jgi:hypothetical protein
VASKGLAQPYAPGEGLIGSPILKSVQAFIEQVHARMNALPRYTIMRNVLAPQLNTSEKGWQTAYQPLPLFGRLRTDESVEGLAGPASMPPQFRPIEFTLVPERARTLDEVSLALRHTDRICQLICFPTQRPSCHARLIFRTEIIELMRIVLLVMSFVHVLISLVRHVVVLPKRDDQKHLHASRERHHAFVHASVADPLAVEPS